jgi:hypothetical protein
LTKIRDPSIQHGGVVTNQQKRFDGCLPGAEVLDDQEDVPYFLLHKASEGYNETECKKKYSEGYNETECKKKYGTGLY